jgi:excisionase family DNA binding protein
VKVVSVPQAAEATGIPYQTLLRLIHEEHLPAVSLPGRRSYLVDVEDLKALVERSKSGSIDGSEREVQPAQVALNKESRNGRKSRRKSGNPNWRKEFRRK